VTSVCSIRCGVSIRSVSNRTSPISLPLGEETFPPEFDCCCDLFDGAFVNLAACDRPLWVFLPIRCEPVNELPSALDLIDLMA
jgi:hypothetical protein